MRRRDEHQKRSCPLELVKGQKPGSGQELFEREEGGRRRRRRERIED